MLHVTISHYPPFLQDYVRTVPAGVAIYIDPLAAQRRRFSPASDMYSLGVIIIQLLTGRTAEEAVDLAHDWNRCEGRGFPLNGLPDPAVEGGWPERAVREWLRHGARSCSALVFQLCVKFIDASHAIVDLQLSAARPP